jgi:hypothetical protein
MNQDDPLLTDEQKKDAKMEAKFKSLLVVGIVEAMLAIITGVADALKKSKLFERAGSKNFKLKKEKSKSKPREKKKSESESGSETSDDSSTTIAVRVQMILWTNQKGKRETQDGKL